MKKLLSCLLVISVILMGSVNIFAIEDNVITVKVEDYNKFENYEWAPIAEYIIIDVPQNATEDEKRAAIDSYFENEVAPQATEISLFTIAVRSGNSTNCELYFRWTGTHIISMISFSNLKIQSTGIISPTVYSNIGGSTIFCSPASSAGTAKIRDISIPTGVTKVKAIITSPMMYSLGAGWLSLTSTNSTITVR